MSDEIKENIRILEQYTNDKEQTYTILDKKTKALRILLDYITNLQEENEKYKKIFEGKERFSKIMPEDIDFIILSKSDYDRQEKDIQLELIDYKSRIDKAIEYSKNCLDNLTTIDEEEAKPFKCIHNNYLDILNGGDEE